MQRTALLVAYNGAAYHGWQLQGPDIPTIQRDLNAAINTIADEEVTLFCAGRTDTGVHATRQVVHFDASVNRPDKAWIMGANAHLPDDISVNWAGTVSPDFDARRTATARHYLYLIHNARARSALMPEYLTREYRVLDAGLMHEAAQSLLGEQDFSSFRAANCQSNSPMRNLMAISVERLGDLVVIQVIANAFLHHMVRNIVGVLCDVGAGDRPGAWVAELLALKDRTKGGVTAPPNGLALIDVHYPVSAGIPRGPTLPHFYQTLGIQTGLLKA